MAPENEQAIADRMLDPSADYPFDLNHVIPAGGVLQFFGRSIANFSELSPGQPIRI